MAALLKGKKPTAELAAQAAELAAQAAELAAQAGELTISKAMHMEKNAYKVNGIQAMVERFVASLAQ